MFNKYRWQRCQVYTQKDFQEIEMGDFITQLILGQREYVRMNSEIKEVVNMISSFIKEVNGNKFAGADITITHYKEGKVRWEVHKSGFEMHVLVFIDGRVGKGINIEHIPLDKVKMVHNTLEGFVKEMMKNYPIIDNNFNLLIATGKYLQKNLIP